MPRLAASRCVAALLLAACGRLGFDGGDLAVDVAVVVDSAQALDLAAAVDAAPPVDLSAPLDAAPPPRDLSPPADGTLTPDLVSPPDSAAPPADLTVGPDATPSPDLVPPPDGTVFDLVAPTCTDGAANGAETDVDCGGGTCPACGVGLRCARAEDCGSRSCKSGRCAAPACNDGVANGAETDVDCGGPQCPKCDAGKACKANADCKAGQCPSGKCAALLLAEDFEDGVLGADWNYWLMKWAEQGGWLTALGEVRPGFNYGHWGNGRSPKTATHVGDKTWTNYRVELDVEALAPGALNPYAVADCCRGATVQFRSEESVESWNAPAETHYSLHFQTRDCPDGGGGWWSQRGGWSLTRVHGGYMVGTGCCSGAQGSSRSLGGGSSPDILDGANHVVVEAAGDVFKVWFNGRLLVDVKDVFGYDAGYSPITYGGIGVTGHWENLVRIDNVRVTTLP